MPDVGTFSLRRPVVPVAGILALAFAALALQADMGDRLLVAAAAGLGLGALLVASLAPWSRLPVWALLCLPVWCDAVIALLRHAEGGSTSGYSPLTILPVVWVGLVLRRREVAAITLFTTALLALPIIVFGAPLYPSTGWRGVALWSVVSAIVGLGANRVVADQLRQTRLAAARAEELARVVATQTAIATTSSDIESVMQTVVEEARRLTGAAAAVVELPEGDDLVYRAAAGTASAYTGMRLAQATALSGHALRSGQVLVCRDSETDSRVDREACRRVGARSMIVVPLLDDGEAAGVLKVYAPVADAFAAEHEQVLALLAGMIGTAVGRAKLLRKLHEQAITDELTGLPNRRAWYHHLELAVARARRDGRPLSVVLLDLDRFKQVNDRDGHQAGDQLLRGVSAAWSATLRETDLLGRLGGDEFGVVLEGADEHAAAEVIARLDAALDTPHTASAGSATTDGDEDIPELLARADADMYRQKRRRTAAAR
jgi:diguanylate cyclase (GGDEF)-like protein